MSPATADYTTTAPDLDAPINPFAAELANAMLAATLNRRGPSAVEARHVPAKPAPAACALVLA